MSRLDQRKSRLQFTTCDVVRERGKLREVVIEGTPYFCVVRLAGMRKAFPISYAAIYHAAAKLSAAKTREEKKARKRHV